MRHKQYRKCMCRFFSSEHCKTTAIFIQLNTFVEIGFVFQISITLSHGHLLKFLVNKMAIFHPKQISSNFRKCNWWKWTGSCNSHQSWCSANFWKLLWQIQFGVDIFLLCYSHPIMYLQRHCVCVWIIFKELYEMNHSYVRLQMLLKKCIPAASPSSADNGYESIVTIRSQ